MLLYSISFGMHSIFHQKGQLNMNITVYLGANMGTDKAYAMEAKALGTWIGSAGHRLIYGGSRAGLMGILADAVLEAGGEVIGVEPSFFIDAEVQHEGITQLIVTDTMTERRAKMIEMGDAYVAFPGGTGTLEEISEVISAKKLGHTSKPVVVLNIEGYYDHLEALFRKMVEEGFLTRKDMDKTFFARTVESAAWHIEHT